MSNFQFLHCCRNTLPSDHLLFATRSKSSIHLLAEQTAKLHQRLHAAPPQLQFTELTTSAGNLDPQFNRLQLTANHDGEAPRASDTPAADCSLIAWPWHRKSTSFLSARKQQPCMASRVGRIAPIHALNSADTQNAQAPDLSQRQTERCAALCSTQHQPYAQ